MTIMVNCKRKSGRRKGKSSLGSLENTSCMESVKLNATFIPPFRQVEFNLYHKKARGLRGSQYLK